MTDFLANAQLMLRIQQLQTRYVQVIDDDRMEEWPQLFTTDGRYTITTRENQFSAMVSFAFNVGLNAYRGSTLLRKHNAGDFAGAAAEFPRWVYAGGEVLPGLVRRREAERTLYLKP
jgi:GH24 family phage-related lysozyme (muramidase)